MSNPMTAEIEFCYETFGGILKKGRPKCVFTGERVNTNWDIFPFAADAVIMRNSYHNGKRMMAAGDPCIVFFNSKGQTITLPKTEWPHVIHDPTQLAKLVKTLSEERGIRESLNKK